MHVTVTVVSDPGSSQVCQVKTDTSKRPVVGLNFFFPVTGPVVPSVAWIQLYDDGGQPLLLSYGMVQCVQLAACFCRSLLLTVHKIIHICTLIRKCSSSWFIAPQTND